MDPASGESTNRSFMDSLSLEKQRIEQEQKIQHDPIQPRQHIGQPDDDSDDEQEVVGHLDPQHPLMDRLQAALFRQLSQEDDRLELELREKREALTQAQTQVTSVGESLYQHQARLAKMQMDLQKTNQQQQDQEKARTTAELLLKERMVQYQEKLRSRQELESKRVQAQRELDHLLVTVQQIDEYNQKVKSEIQVTRRAAYGTEESMQQMEKQNLKAQTLIDNLNNQINNNEEQIRLYEAQIDNQKLETKQAQATLDEAAKEMELIAVEKREYLQKWRTSIVGMRNRDEALETAYAAADAQRQTLQNLELSLSGYKQAIRSEQIENEKLTAILNRVEAETRFMDQQLQAIADTKKNLNNKHTVLRASLERVESALKSALQTQREIRAEIDALHKAHEKLMTEKQEIDDTIMEHLNSQTTLEKGAQNVWKLTQKLKQQVHEKEIQMGEINNEIARIKVDTLNTGAHNKELEATLQAYDHELKEKDKLIEKYELEIRQRHDKIEKKQIYIARLNRKFETLTTNIQEENTGPLEATIANLSKEIIQTTREVSDMQREWIKSQTELVGLVSDTSEVDEHVTQQRAKAVVLQQKHIRINMNFNQIKEDIKELEYGIKTMHHDLQRFNRDIADSVRRQEELANNNYTMEIDHMEKLKQREQDTVKMNAATERLQFEYQALRDEIIAVEQEIMLWEKKIQLERETQEALDPEYGQPEIKGMKKEIHRMRLRLQQLKREQEKLIQMGEKTIMKRPMVSLARTTKVNSNLTEAGLAKEIQRIQNQLQEDSKAQEKITNEIQQQMLACEELSQQLQQHQDEYGIIENRKIELQQEITNQQLQLAVNEARVMVLQHHGQSHASEVKRALASSSDGEVKKGNKPPSKEKKVITTNEQEKLAQLQRQQQQYEAALARERSRFESLQHLISSQCDPENNPKYHDWFKKLYQQIPSLNT